MNIAPTIQDYLAEHQIAYEVLAHAPTSTSATTAQAAHLPGRSVAKAVVVEDESGRYAVAVLPATAHVQLARLERELHRSGLRLADEPELEKLFPDCAPGAIPPLGQAYGLPTVVEEELAAQPDVFFEAGDHRHLVHVSQGEFSRLIAEARCARFSS
jgi:Ala-tRNA(Pro) deacylase